MQLSFLIFILLIIGSVGTYVVYDPSLTYFAQMTNGGSPVYQIELTVAACTGKTKEIIADIR